MAEVEPDVADAGAGAGMPSASGGEDAAASLEDTICSACQAQGGIDTDPLRELHRIEVRENRCIYCWVTHLFVFFWMPFKDLDCR